MAEDSNFDLREVIKKYFLGTISQEEAQFLQESQKSNVDEVQQIAQDLQQNDSEIQQRIREQQEQQSQQFAQQKAQVDALRFQQNFTEQGAISKLRADSEEAQILSQGGKKVLHLTDTELEAPDLEQRLLSLLHYENGLDSDGKLRDDFVLVHTGDIGPDLFNMQKWRTQAYLPDIVAKEGNLDGEQKEEFIALYKELMDEAGISEELLLTGIKTEQDQQRLARFQYLLLGHMDPDFKSEEELNDFRNRRSKLHSHLEDAILNHSKRNLSEIKKVFEKYGLNENNSIVLSGNHDVPHLVKETFGDSYLEEGETRELNGIKFNRPLGTATGSVYGPSVGREFMGSNELVEKIPEMRYNSQAFSELRNYVKQNGFDHFDDKQIDTLIKTSVAKSQMGLASGELSELNKKIEDEVQLGIKTRLERLHSTLDRDADVYLGHGDVTHPQFAGLEETQLRKLLDRSGKVYLGGHIHQETTNQTNGTYYVNPGASAQGSHGAIYLDSSNEFIAAKSQSINPLQQLEVNYRDKRKGEIGGSRINDAR